MSSIIVAIDFSNTSIHALEYAIPIANKMKSDINLIWVDKISSQESVYPDTTNENRNEAKKRFDELIHQYHKKLTKGITMEYRLKKGRIYREVDSLAKITEADLIITGAHGISGFEEYWIGSNAYKIVTYASRPVITVRHDFPIRKNIDRIIVPMDQSAETLQKIPFIVRLATLFKSEVHVVTTHNSHLKSIQRLTEKVAQTALRYFQGHDIRLVEDSIVSNDLTKALLTYSLNVDADLIAIMTEQETPAKILLGAQAQQLVNQSPIPVLSIHPHESVNPS
ncbi:MAG: universal stress protein [Bacteroidales bacterium]|nr:universal stress protein [Bacteroidales bacterium]HNW74678.1 universal stress protein [Bacteroidales bacterium]HPS51585.1 universal stress protein [Bacteroidales bacterium]